jgi:hypothetical protein
LVCSSALPGCVCFETSSGGGICGVGTTPCSASGGSCPNGQSDCPTGFTCVVDSCCGAAECFPNSETCPADEERGGAFGARPYAPTGSPSFAG